MVCQQRSSSAFEQWAEHNLEAAIMWRLNPQVDTAVSLFPISCTDSDQAIIAVGAGCIASLCDLVERNKHIATLIVPSYAEFGWLIKQNSLFQGALDAGISIIFMPLVDLKKARFMPERPFRRRWLANKLMWCASTPYQGDLDYIRACTYDRLSFLRFISPELLGGLINIIKNLPHLTRTHLVSPLGEILRDVPVIIAGGGPSLIEALPVIQRHRKKALILAAGAAVKPLLDAGITPDLVGYCDPTEAQNIRSAHLVGLSIPALISLEVFPGCLHNLQGPLLLRHDNAFGVLGKHIFRLLGCREVPPPLSIASDITSLIHELVLDLGARTIHFVGRELSFVESAYSDARICPSQEILEYQTAEGCRRTTPGWLSASLASAEIVAGHAADCSSCTPHGLPIDQVQFVDTEVWFSRLPQLDIHQQWHGACARLAPITQNVEALHRLQRTLIKVIKGEMEPTNQHEQAIKEISDHCLTLFVKDVLDPSSDDLELLVASMRLNLNFDS